MAAQAAIHGAITKHSRAIGSKSNARSYREG